MKYIFFLTLFLSFEVIATQKECLFTSGGEFQQGQQIGHHFRAKVLKDLNQLTIREDILRSELNIRSFDDFSLNIYASEQCDHLNERADSRCFSTYLRGHHNQTYFYLKDRDLYVVRSNNVPWEISTEDIYICD